MVKSIFRGTFNKSDINLVMFSVIELKKKNNEYFCLKYFYWDIIQIISLTQ